MKARLLQTAASVSFRPKREVFCRVAAAQPRPPQPIGLALGRSAASSRSADRWAGRAGHGRFAGDEESGLTGDEKRYPTVENRSGVVELTRPLRMFLSCRRHRRAARPGRVRRILSRGVSFRVDVLCFRIRLSRISRSSLDLAPLKMRSSSADVCDRIRTKCRRVSH